MRPGSAGDARRPSGGDIDHQGHFGEACAEIGRVVVHVISYAGTGEVREGEAACWRWASGAVVVLGDSVEG